MTSTATDDLQPPMRLRARPAAALAVERRLEALSLPALALAGGAAVLIQVSEMLVLLGPFPKDMQTRYLELYGAGSFGILKLVMVFIMCSDLVRRYGVVGLVNGLGGGISAFVRGRPWTQWVAIFRRGRLDRVVSQPASGAYGVLYCALILVCALSAFYDALACFSRGRRNFVPGMPYEPCNWYGTRTDEYEHCRTGRIALFIIQLLSLGVTIPPATVHGLTFAIILYKTYGSLLGMDMQTKIYSSREAQARRPSVEDELDVLKAEEGVMAVNAKPSHDPESSLESKAKVGLGNQKIETEKQSERADKQKDFVDTRKID